MARIPAARRTRRDDLGRDGDQPRRDPRHRRGRLYRLACLQGAGSRRLICRSPTTISRPASPAAVKWGPLEEGSLHDRARLDEVIARHAPLAVMHFAARSDVGESARDPGQVLARQRRRVADPDRGDARGRRRPAGVLVDLCGLRRPGRRDPRRGLRDPADQPLRLVEAGDRGHGARLRRHAMGSGRSPSAISTSPGPTRRPRSARHTTPRRTWCR